MSNEEEKERKRDRKESVYKADMERKATQQNKNLSDELNQALPKAQLKLSKLREERLTSPIHRI